MPASAVSPRRLPVLLLALVAGLVLEPDPGLWLDGMPVAAAEARVGRPLTPMSYAGVARRTSRRMVYATGAYLHQLPQGCPLVVVDGNSLYFCGGTYYQASGSGYVIVNVQ